MIKYENDCVGCEVCGTVDEIRLHTFTVITVKSVKMSYTNLTEKNSVLNVLKKGW